MYALKARDKLHKRQKDELKERQRDDRGRARDNGESSREQRRKPSTASRMAKYIGTFSIEMNPSWKNDVGKAVKHQLSKLKTKDSSSCQLPVCLHINMEGVKVLSPDGRELIMAHALRRILYSTADGKKHLFAMVSRNPDTGPEGIYSHVFVTAKKDQANELNDLVGKAFKASFTKKSLRRHKQLVKGSGTPWKVVTPEQPPATTSQQPLPSAPPPALSVQAPPTSPPAYNRDHLLLEASQLESDVARIQAHLFEIESQIREVAGIEDAVLQLTVQLSTHQQQLEEKKRRLGLLQQEIRATAGFSPPPYSPPVDPHFGANPLPDFISISLEDAEWFQEGLPRDIAMEILSYQPEGGFIVRKSSSNPGCYALSLKAPQGKIVHYLIENLPTGFRLQGSPDHLIFPSLVDLIQHLTFNRENLPCTLCLDTSNPAQALQDSDSDPDDVDFARPTQYHLLT